MTLRRIAWRRFAVMCVSLVMTLTIVSAAHAQSNRANEPFNAGQEALGKSNWAEAATQMRRAIEIEPNESENKVVRGNVFSNPLRRGEPYLPYFFLGQALAELQQCAAAVESWSRSEQQGVVKSTPYFGELQKGYAACEAKGVLPPAKYEPLQRGTNQHVTEVIAQATNVSRLANANMDLWQSVGKDPYDRAVRELETARARLEAGTKSRSPNDFNEANAAADRARGILVTIEGSLNSAIVARQTLLGVAAQAETAIKEAEATDREIEGRKGMLTSSLQDARSQAQAILTRAKDRLAPGTRTFSANTINEARTLAQDATNRFKQVLDDVMKLEREELAQKVSQAAASAQDALSFADATFSNLDKLAADQPTTMTPEMTATRNSVQARVAQLRRRFETAREAQNVTAINELTRLTRQAVDQLNDLISAFRPLTILERGVSEALARAATLFFSGKYAETLSALDSGGADTGDARLAAHVHLFRAAASYALFVVSGEKDLKSRQRALDEIEECKRMNPALEPDPRAFAPRFINLFHNGDPPTR